MLDGKKSGIGLNWLPAIGLIFTFGALSAHVSHAQENSNNISSGLASCATSVESTPLGEAVSTGMRCAGGRMITEMIDRSLSAANKRGQNLFGENFLIHNRLTYSFDGDSGLNGDLDAVIPLSFSSSSADGKNITRTLFMQQGITRWKDNNGFRRNDMRYGLVHRFALSSERPDIIGISAFYQHSLERAHQRLVAGFDYAGIWGGWSFNYFKPITEWVPGREGFEERALEGMDLGLRLNLTSTIDLNMTASRWENEDDPTKWTNGGRFGVKWQPHSWLQFETAYDIIEAEQDPISLRAGITIPLSGWAMNKPPAWQGLGIAGAASHLNNVNIWRPIENIGKIRFAEREIVIDENGVVKNAKVRFLQNSAVSGKEFKLEVALDRPVSRNVKLLVLLTPGNSGNPAVAGEDYVDEPFEVTILKGDSSTVKSVRLMLNRKMKKARSLDVTILLADLQEDNNQ